MHRLNGSPRPLLAALPRHALPAFAAACPPAHSAATRTPADAHAACAAAEAPLLLEGDQRYFGPGEGACLLGYFGPGERACLLGYFAPG